MEDVSKGEKIKNIQEEKIKPKMISCIKTYIIAYVKIQIKWRYTIHYVKRLFKNRLPKGGPTCRRQVVNPRHQTSISCKAWNSPAEYPSWVAWCDIKGSDGTMLNPIFWKKVQGQKHPGRCGIVEHQIPSIKVLFKTNVKSHKHPGIKLWSSESQTQLVNQRKQNSYRKCIYTYIY